MTRRALALLVALALLGCATTRPRAAETVFVSAALADIAISYQARTSATGREVNPVLSSINSTEAAALSAALSALAYFGLKRLEHRTGHQRRAWLVLAGIRIVPVVLFVAQKGGNIP